MVDRKSSATELQAVDFGFRKQQRLKTAADFSEVLDARRPLRGKVFDLYYRPHATGASPSPTGARLGLVIAKKLAHRAVQRNLLKRLVRETFRLARPQLPPYDMVLRLAKFPGDRLDPVARSSWRADIEHLLLLLPR